LKINIKGIRFSTWLYFLGFSISILLLLGFLLVSLIKPYYRNNRIETINTISSTIEEKLIKGNASQKEIDETAKLVIGNNVCVVIFNENGKSVYESDSLGQLCMLNKEIEINNERYVIEKQPQKFIDILSEESTYSLSLQSDITDIEMILYGTKIKSNLANYYLVINTPLEPIESYIDFILSQYSYISIIIILIALVVAFFLARKISLPIITMQKEANKLADGNYDVKFETKSYTEINELANTLDDATQKLSRVNDLRKDLVANVSHDIKTPLTMIKAYAEMIKDISGEDPAKRNEHLDVIIKETDYLNKLVTDMSELSKLQSGNIEITKSNFDLRNCVLDVIELIQHVADEKNIELVTNLDDVVVYADEIKISQVIYNFVSNAIKHSDDNQKIVINVKNFDEEKLRVEVIDEGDGIPEEAIPYIWDRYYKVDKNFNRNVNSTGLGLAIAKAILEAHGAKYGVISKEGKGSTFYFELSTDYDSEE